MEEKDMTDVYCDICEEQVGEIEELNDLDDLPTVALWTSGHSGRIEGSVIICNDCCVYGYNLMERKNNESD